MKYLQKLILFISLTTLQNSFSEEQKAIENKTMDALAKAMEIPGVKEVYTNCKQPGRSNSDVSDCLWKNLDDGKKEQVLQVIEQTKDGKKLDARYESVSTGGLEGSQKKGFENLEKYLNEKLSAVLFEEVSGDKKFIQQKVAGQEVFYDLFKTQVGKNIISAFSSICLDAEYATKTTTGPDGQPQTTISYTIDSDSTKRKAARDKNLQDAASFSSSSKQNYMECIKLTPTYCSCTVDPATKTCVDNMKDGYTKMRACEVVNYIKAAKQNLIAIDKIKKGYDELDMVETNDPSYFSGNEKGKTVDDLTTVTSGEFVAESKFHEGSVADKEKIEECVKNKDLGEECSQFLEEQDEDFIGEQMLRNKALAEKLKEDLKDDGNLEKYLKDQGYSDEKIKEMMAGDIENLKAEITGRYELQKNQVIESLSKKLAAATNQNTNLSPEEVEQEKLNRLTTIGHELSQKTENYAQLIHYSNVVAGYLDVQSSGQNGGRDVANDKQNNTYSISKELSNSAFSEEGTEKAREIINTFNNNNIIVNAEEAEEKLEAAGIKVQHNPSENTANKIIQVEEINSLVNDYTVEEELRQKEEENNQ